MAKDKLVEVKVARGKSIQIHDEENPKAPPKHFMPGETCRVPEYEVKRLLKQGFIVDPEAEALNDKEIADLNISNSPFIKGGTDAENHPAIGASKESSRPASRSEVR